MAKSIEPVSLFAKSTENDFFISQEDFEKSLRLFIKIVMLSEFNPLSITCNYSKSNAIVTVKNLKEATEFMENYKRLPKPEFFFEVLAKTQPINNAELMQQNEMKNNILMPSFNSKINPIQPTEKLMNRNNIDDPLVNMIDMMNINKNPNINNINENNNNNIMVNNFDQNNNKENQLNYQINPNEREFNQMNNYNNNNFIGNNMEMQQRQFLQNNNVRGIPNINNMQINNNGPNMNNMRSNNMINMNNIDSMGNMINPNNKDLNQIRQGIPGINQIPMNFPQNFQIPQKTNIIMNQQPQIMNNMNPMNMNNIPNKFNQSNPMTTMNHMININPQMTQMGIINPLTIHPNEMSKFGQIQMSRPNMIGNNNNNFIPKNLPQINSIGVVNPMPNIGIPGINHINEMNGFPINNINPYMQQSNINENRFPPNHNSIPHLFNNQIFQTGENLVENEKLVFNQNEKNSNIDGRVELNFNEERLKELNSEELSNEIFELVSQIHENEAAKITGMISELGESQMRHLLLNPLELKDTINHAYQV